MLSGLRWLGEQESQEVCLTHRRRGQWEKRAAGYGSLCSAGERAKRGQLEGWTKVLLGGGCVCLCAVELGCVWQRRATIYGVRIFCCRQALLSRGTRKGGFESGSNYLHSEAQSVLDSIVRCG